MASSNLSSLSHMFNRLSLASQHVCLSCRIAARPPAVRTSFDGPARSLLPHAQTRNASHAAAGVANGPKNRPGRRLGAKRGNGEYVTPNTIIFRQRGTLWHPGENAACGRDHTIVASVPGYVRYYRDPARHPDKKYIGVVYDAEDKLPYPANAPRRRRLGLVAVPMRDQVVKDVVEGTEYGETVMVSDGLVGTEAGKESDIREAPAVTTTLPEPPADGKSWPWESYSDIFSVTDKVGRTRSLKQGTGGAYRQSNFELGRAAEHAGVRVQPYKKDRFLAWRKSSARKASNALAKNAGKRKSKAKAKK